MAGRRMVVREEAEAHRHGRPVVPGGAELVPKPERQEDEEDGEEARREARVDERHLPSRASGRSFREIIGGDWQG